MIKRETLQTIKKQLKTDTPPSISQTMQLLHSLVDSNLEALELIDGGTTLANRNTEARNGLGELREVLLNAARAVSLAHQDEAQYQLDRASFILGLIDRQMLTTDYRRYSSWADIRPQITEEFGEYRS